MSLLPKITFNADASQLIYAVIVIILVPAALAFNTLFLIKSVQRDMDFELNNKALLVESVIAIQSREKMQDPTKLKSEFKELVVKLPEIRAVEFFTLNQEDLMPIVSTSPLTKSVTDPVLNQLAWGSNQAYSKQIFATIGSSQSERTWLVASPVHDSQGKKIGLLNLYLSAAQIDSISNRTSRDSLIILVVTMLVIMLLLLNHFRFFEISILFKRLSELDKLKDDFISMASHELKTPLTAVSGYTYLMLKHKAVLADEKLKKFASIIYESTERLKVLVDDILDVSRIEQRRVTLNMVHNDITAVINSVVNEYMLAAQTKKLALRYQRPPVPLLVYSDRAKIHQVFSNLVSNAIKYTPSGSILIYHEVKDSSVKTFVKDSGVGISAENRDKLFAKFTRFYNERTKNVYGTGLGLWITKQFVEKMGGKITVDSIENSGTQFIVSFPLRAIKGSQSAKVDTSAKLQQKID